VKRHLIISPHLDDAVLSAWSLISGKEPVQVLNVFTAEPALGAPVSWWDVLTGATDPVARMRERAKEDRRALALAGREAINLGFTDWLYRDGGVPVGPVEAAIAAHLDAADEIWVPAGLGDHDDHVAIRELGAGWREQGRTVGVYADIPHSTHYGWPHWVASRPADPHLDVDAYWQLKLRRSRLPFGRMRARPVRLDAATSAAKACACREYRTQLPALEAGPVKDVTHPELLPFEVYWDG
jgi:hypothetical protein